MSDDYIKRTDWIYEEYPLCALVGVFSLWLKVFFSVLFILEDFKKLL